MMILYLCLGIIVIGIGFVTIFFVVKEEESIFRAIPGGIFIALGIAMAMSSLTLSGRVTEKTSVVVATTTDASGVELALADGTKVPCQPEQYSCQAARVGNLVMYQTRRHESGLWIHETRVNFVTRGPGQ
jgi:hypothetical protein